jgi:predicted ATPase/class 3 adenylate cyclase
MTAATLPSGLVTFVLTDIEGSTKMFRHLGDAYPPILDAHNALLRAQWKAHGGAEVKTVGDSFIVAFASATDAMLASVAAQRAVADHPWPSDGVIRIRIGVHAGMAFPRDGDYVALALHQAARVEGAANGGQVIASDDAVTAAGEAAAVRYQPIGAFRLRDFERPVRLAAVLGADDRLDEPISVRAIPAEGHNLVPVPTSFIGRAEDVDDIGRKLRPGALLTIVGPGGMGKTRLAMEAGRRVVPAWPDGVWFVDLSKVSDERRVLSALAGAVGLPPADPDDEQAAVEAHLESRRALLILDNCEHVLGATARLVDKLLGRCPYIGVLATSRVPLAIQAEERWRIESLPIERESLRLLMERARARAPDYAFSAADEPIVAEICRRLDGMPLAIELAAARLAVLSPAEILAGLERRFRLLRTNDPAAEPRLRSMQALLDWGQALLTPTEQAVFRRLAIFRASFDLAAAAAANTGFGDVDPDDVAEIVWSLADQSLLGIDRAEGHTRYRMLETVRAYADDRLAESAEGATARKRLGEHYLARFPWDQATSGIWISGLGLEGDTLAPLIDSLLADGESDDGLALARLLAVVRHVEGRLALALDDLERAIERAQPSSSMLARAHTGAVLIAARLGQIERAERHLREARQLVEARGAHDRWGRVSLARSEAEIALRTSAAPALALAAEHLKRELDAPLSVRDRADVIATRGEVLGDLGDPEGVNCLTEAVALNRALGDGAGLGGVLSSLAEQELRQGDSVNAARHQREALHLAADLALPMPIACAFIIAARLAEPEGFADTALRLHGKADAMLEEIGFSLFPSDQALSDAMRERIRLRLDQEHYDSATSSGRDLTLHATIELADEVFTRTVESPAPLPQAPGSLTGPGR